jgi:hypothetical protein
MTTIEVKNWTKPTPAKWQKVGDVVIFIVLPVASLAVDVFVPVGIVAKLIGFGILAVSLIIKGLTKMTHDTKDKP